MTFQVALVGADCTVVGSDRLFSEYSRHEVRNVAQRAPTCKILIAADRSFVCAHAGGAQSREMAREVVNKCQPQNRSQAQWESHLKEILEPIWGTSGEIVDELIIARAGSAVLTIAKRKGGTPTEIASVENYICAGDIYLPARFLPVHLWREDMPEDSLKKLALLTLACAHEDNPSGIGCGYDIVTLRNDAATIQEDRFTLNDGRKQYEEFRSKARSLI